MKKLLLITVCILQFVISVPFTANGQSNAVSFTQQDRDRIIRIEEKLNSQQKQINDLKENIQQQINGLKGNSNDLKENMQQQINFLKELFYLGFSIMISFMLFLLGFIIWDRRTAMNPIRVRTESLMYSLREYAKEQPKLADILRMR